MLKKSDIEKAKDRRKVWDHFGWGYKGRGIGYLSQNHSLNDGCTLCKYSTFWHRRKNKQTRLKIRKELKQINDI